MSPKPDFRQRMVHEPLTGACNEAIKQALPSESILRPATARQNTVRLRHRQISPAEFAALRWRPSRPASERVRKRLRPFITQKPRPRPVTRSRASWIGAPPPIAGGFVGVAGGRRLSGGKHALRLTFGLIVVAVGLYVIVRGLMATA